VKIIKLIIILLFIVVNIYSNMIFAAVNLSVESSNINNQFFNITLNANGTDLIAGASIQLTFDKTKVKISKLLQAHKGSFCSNVKDANQNGLMRMVYIDFDGNGLDSSNNIQFAELEFKSLATKSTDTVVSVKYTFSDFQLNNVSENKTVNEVITLDKSSNMYVKIEIPPEEKLDPIFDIECIAKGTGLVSGSQVKLNFDNSKLKVLSITSANGLWVTKEINKINQDSFLKLVSLDIDNNPMRLSDNPLLATIQFQIICEGDSFINIDNIMTKAYDSEMNNIPITADSVQLKLLPLNSKIIFLLEGPEKVPLNKEFLFNLKITPLQETSILGIQTKLRFDSTKLNVTNLFSNSDFNVLSSTIERANVSGIINFAYIDLTGNGKRLNSYSNPEFASVTFKTKNKGNASIYIEESSIVLDSFMNKINKNNDELNIQIETTFISEREALIDLYNSTNGENWINKTNWLGEHGTECSWFGVICDEFNHIKELNLFTNNLQGVIPQSIQKLSFIVSLFLHDNNLVGNIPLEIFEIDNLQSISLKNNNLANNIVSLSKQYIQDELNKPVTISVKDAIHALEVCAGISTENNKDKSNDKE